jgi:hypothetical protein
VQVPGTVLVEIFFTFYWNYWNATKIGELRTETRSFEVEYETKFVPRESVYAKPAVRVRSAR